MIKKSAVSLFISITLFACLAVTANAAEAGDKYEFSIKYNGNQPVKLKNSPFRDNYSGRIYYPVAEIFSIIDPESKQKVIPTTNKFINSDLTYLISLNDSCYELGNSVTTITVYDKTCSVPTDKQVSILYGTSINSSESPTVYAPLEFFINVFAEKTDIQNNSLNDDNKLTIRTSEYKQFVELNNKIIILKVNNPWMYVNEEVKQFDSTTGSTPIIKDGSTLLPIANIIKEFGGSVKWDGTEQKVSIYLDKNNVDLWINKPKAIVNGIEKTLTISPAIITNKTMLPLRFVSDNLGLKLVWDGDNQVIALYRGDFDFIPVDYSQYFKSKDSDQKTTTNEKTNDNKQTTNESNKDKPIDKNGVTIQVGDRVTFSFFYGEVKKIDGGRILVFWDSKDNLYLKDADADYWASLGGIRYLSSSWSNASDITVDK